MPAGSTSPYLDASIASRAVESTVAKDATVAKPASQMTGILKSVQRGTISLSTAQASNTATITSVNTAKSVVAFLGNKFTSGYTTISDGFAHVALTNATTVTVTRDNTSSSVAMVVGYQVMEYY